VQRLPDLPDAVGPDSDAGRPVVPGPDRGPAALAIAVTIVVVAVLVACVGAIL
jgi:hypothetical protein